MGRTEGDDDTLLPFRPTPGHSEEKSPPSNSAACSTTPGSQPASWKSRPAPAAPRPRTGRRCCAHVPRYGERKGFGVEVMEEPKATWPASRAPPSNSATTPTAPCAPKPASTAWCGNRRSTPTPGATPASLRFVYPSRRLHRDRHQPADVRTDTFRPPAPAASTSTRPTRRYASPIADWHRRPVPERPFAAPQPRRSLENAARPPLRARTAEAAGRAAKLEDAKSDIGWGHQIRSYVLDQSRIKDLRTNYEVGNTQAVLDGDLDGFIEASLEARV